MNVYLFNIVEVIQGWLNEINLSEVAVTYFIDGLIGVVMFMYRFGFGYVHSS